MKCDPFNEKAYRGHLYFRNIVEFMYAPLSLRTSVNELDIESRSIY